MGEPPAAGPPNPPSPLSRAKEVFLAVRGLPLPARDEEADRLCGGDAVLRGMVEGLLAGDQSPLPFESLAEEIVAARDAMAPTAAGASGGEAADRDSQLGSRIGRYRVLEKIGEGGFGVVYLAEQEEPVRRRVALKILKLGMDTRQVVARFEAERQALAIMDHPGIAKVHDAGATPSGRPFFVMELCAGTSITDYCDRHRVSVRARLDLFAQVCHAVQHAHQKGLIHRDIKPSNILVSQVDGRPLAKVIDFGIAKATQARLTEKTIFTESRQLIGTPEYMSPEQAEGSLDIDTRTDVYSLGVLLYELLTGATPFTSKELRSAAFDELQRIIREVEPPRPSTRLSLSSETLASVAANRSTEPRRLGTVIRGELDWIVMKALEKSRQRRYASAADFAADVERYLNDQPVVAKPATALYRWSKFARRNKVLVGASAAVLLSLAVGLVATSLMYVRAERARGSEVTQRKRAEREATKARAINGFLVDDMLAAPNPWEGAGRKISVADVLDKASAKVESRFGSEAAVEAAVRTTLGESYRSLGMFREAEPHYARALELRSGAGAAAGGDEVELAESLRMHAANLNALGKPAEAETACRDALARHTRLSGATSVAVALTLETLGEIQITQTRFADAEKSYREAIRIMEASVPEAEGDGLRRSVSLARLTNSVGTALHFLGKHKEAEKTKKQALKQFRAALGEGHPYVAQVLNDLGASCAETERYEDALDYYEQALPIMTDLLGRDHQVVVTCRRNIANATSFLGRNDEAEPLLRESIADSERLFGANHPETMAAVNSLATMFLRTKRPADAAPLLKSLYERSGTALGEKHAETLKYASNLAWCYSNMKEYDEAEKYFRIAFDGFEQTLGRTHENTIAALDGLAQLLDRMKRWPEAARADERIIADRAAAGIAEDMDTARYYNRVGTSWLMAKEYAKAREPFERSLELCRRLVPGVDFRTALAMGRLGECLSMLDERAEAERLLVESLKMSREDPNGGKQAIDRALRRLVAHYERTGETGAVERYQRELTELGP